MIRDKLDQGLLLSGTEDDPYTVAFVMMDFLAALATPILPVHIMDEVVSEYEQAGDTDSGCI